MTDDLVAFIRARMDEDEHWARHAMGHRWASDQTIVKIDQPWNLDMRAGTSETACHIARHDPARVLREVEAKRRILDEHGNDGGDCRICARSDVMDVMYDPESDEETVTWPSRPVTYPCPTVRLVGMSWADDPGYRDEWRP